MATAYSSGPQIQAGGGQPACHPSMNGIGHVSATILKYIKGIADGTRPLNLKQQSELYTYSQTTQKAEAVVHGHSPGQGLLGLHTLLDYMTSGESNAMRPLPANDLCYPISSYYISSSHNTYLTGNQLYGDASTDAYTNVLLRGCRCIEIDVWDGEERPLISNEDVEQKHHIMSRLRRSLSAHLSKRLEQEVSPVAETDTSESLALPTPWISATTAMRAEPRVLHGHTMTKEVSFRAVCASIRDAAFVTSDLPVVVSLEVHASSEQQEIMVDIMQELWKGMLVEDPGEACAVLPSPIALKRMLVVKVAKSVDSNVTSLGSTLKVHSAASQSDSQDEVSNNTAKAKAKGKKHIVIQALSALGVYAHSYHFRNLSSLEARIPTHVFSLSERKFMQVHETQGDDLFSHNRNYLMRTYPGYQRVSSSNLDPAFFWRKGVQMVALNWQSLDAGMMLNEGMFGGASGWILKPEGYRRLHAVPGSSPKDNLADSMPHKILNLTIEVFAAQDLPLPLGEIRPNHYQPYVKCELHIEKAEERSGDPIAGGGRSRDGEHKRTTKASKGIEPDFGGVLMDFTGIADVVEELSFVRFKIEDDCVGKDRLGAWACIRLDRLRDGLRFVHLFDARGIESRGILLIKTSKTTA